MRCFLRALPLAATLAAAAPSSTPAQSPSTLRRDVEALHAAIVAAFKTDPATVARFYTDDASIMFSGGRYVGREQVDQYWRQGPFPETWTLEVLEVGGDSLTPWVRGRSTLTGQSGRRQVVDYIGLLKRQPDGQLRYYVDMFVGVPGMVMRRPGGAQ
jgi:ketosteroid isomerase-like protein